MLSHLGRDVVAKENALSDDVCDKLIKLFEDPRNSPQEKSKATGDYDTGTRYYELVIYGDTSPKLKAFLKKLVQDALLEYCELLNIDFPIGQLFERIDIMKFCKNKDDKFHVHFDGNGEDYSRTVALIFYLNDVDEGGVLHLPSKENYIKVKPQKGKLVFTPTDWTHYHFVDAPISHDRYSVITFIHF